MQPMDRGVYSLAVLGKQACAAMQLEGATLSFSARRSFWKVKSKQPWLGRNVSLMRVRKKLHHVFKKLTQPPGKRLCDAYTLHLQSNTAPMLGEKHFEPEGIRIKVASAFILAGVCEISKGDRLSKLKSTKTPINQRVISRLDHLASCSPLRLAYEFLAENKQLPKGYLSQVLQPALVASLTDNGTDTGMARLIVHDQLLKCGISKEKHISLESMLEVKNRIRHLALSYTSAPSMGKPMLGILKKAWGPSLEAPEVKPGYECDSDDLWLIQHTVKNGRTLRLVGDFTNRILRWAQRNKQTALITVSGLAFEMLLSGLFTGGIGAAVTGVTSLAATVGLFAWDKTILEVRALFARRKLRQLGNHPNSEEKFDQFLDSCVYLTSQKGVTNIFNAYANLEASVDKVKNQKNFSEMNVKEQVSYQKKKALTQLRNEQLQQCFGVEGSENPGDIASYDQLMVKTIQEISRLDAEFENSFDDLWAPFESMPASERWSIFNQAANQRAVKGRWYEVSRNYRQWIRQTFSGGVGLNARLKTAFNDIPDSYKETKFEFAKLHNWNVGNMANIAKMVTSSFANFLLEAGLSVVVKREKVARLIRSRRLTSIKNFLPKQWGPFVAVWAFYYFGHKITKKMNHSMNAMRIADLHEHSLKHRFDDRGERLSTEKWRALRRESKDTLSTFVDTLKDLRNEHRKIERLLNKKKEALTDMPVNKRNKLFATILLRRKMLEQQINTLLAGAVGHMHEETVKAVWHQQQSLKAIEIV